MVIFWLTCVVWGLADFTHETYAATISGNVSIAGDERVDDTVIYLDVRKEPTFSPPTTHAKVALRDHEFVPRVLPILVGTTVDFSNADDVSHDVFSPDAWAAPELEFTSWAHKETRSYAFNKFGIVPLRCRLHTSTPGYVVVLDVPYFAVADTHGRYAIADVPPGIYVLHTWHEGSSAVSQPVTLREGDAAVINVELKQQ